MRIWLDVLLVHVWAGALESLWLGGLSTPTGEWQLGTGIVEAYSLQDASGFPGVLFAAGRGLLEFFTQMTIWSYAYMTGLTGLMLRGVLTLGSLLLLGMAARGQLGRVGG